MKEKELPYFPYVLIDPRRKRKLSIYYAGITQQPLHLRVVQHIHEAKNFQGGRAKMERTRAILDAGMRPLILGIGTVPGRKWEVAERRLIAFLRENKVKLTNKAAGGKGQLGTHHSAATKKKIAASVSRARQRPGRRVTSSLSS